MENELIIEAWKAGGKQREDAMRQVFNDNEIRKSIERITMSYKNNILNYFPNPDKIDGIEQRKSYVDHLFIEAVVILDRKIRNNQFEGEIYSQLANFISVTAKFVCIAFLRDKKVHVDIEEHDFSYDSDDSFEFEKESTYHKLHEVLNKIGRNCKELLLKFYSGFSMQEIADQLNLASADVAKQSKARCMKSLKTEIGNNPDFITT